MSTPYEFRRGEEKDKNFDWETPQWLYDDLNDEFHFDLDAAASDACHKCDKYFTVDDDGLQKNWGGTRFGATRHITGALANG